MLKHRLIPCVLLKDWQLVKSVQFGSFRTIGHPTATVRVYNARNVDELIVLDIDASLNGEPINTEIITDMANECFMPLTIGGGIKTIEDVYEPYLIQAGFISRTPKGRVASPLTYKHLGLDQNNYQTSIFYDFKVD